MGRIVYLMSNADIIFDIELIIRIVLSGICGFAIGYERKSRGKGAGVRTHMIVALSASLMMVISKYGFTDMARFTDRGTDGSRIAAQIVSGVGFLGAGMIYVHRNSISGLTTAAGIWATSGIGMAIGAGMYFIGIVSAFVVLFSQIILHKDLKILQMPQEVHITIDILDTEEARSFVRNKVSEAGWQIDRIKTKRSDGTIRMEIDTNIPTKSMANEYLAFFEHDEFVQSVEIQ